MDPKLWCGFCKKIMNNPTACKSKDCPGMVCRECIKPLHEANVIYAISQPLGPRCPGNCRGRYFAIDGELVHKNYTWLFWSKWTCENCNEEFLYDEKNKHFQTCIKYKCNSEVCPMKDHEFQNCDELARHFATNCYETKLTCVHCDDVVKRGEKDAHNCVKSLAERVKSIK